MKKFLDRVEANPVYVHVAPLLAIIALTIAIAAGIGTYINDRAVTSTNTDRIEDQETILGCFDDYATQLSGALPPLRDASAARDIALGNAIGTLRQVLVRALAGESTPADGPELVSALEGYEQASDALEQARADNPYPDPPSRFCTLPE